MKIGLFFGSFNPIHIGHLIIANTLSTDSDLDEIWMVVTPQNPLKKQSSLAKDYDRLYMAQEAIGDQLKIKVSNIEFGLPKPSYTIDTLAHLSEKFPDKTFSLIMGGDNLATIDKWKNYEVLLKNYDIYLYNRPSYDIGKYSNLPNVHVVDAPLLEISSSLIRKRIKAGKSVQYFVTQEVLDFIESKGLYR